MFRKWHEGAIHEKPLLSVYKGAVPGVYRSRLALTAEDLGKCVSTFSALCGRSSSGARLPAMLVEESRVFQVATFGALHLHQSELDPNQLLSDAMVIADEVDAQLREAVLSWTAAA